MIFANNNLYPSLRKFKLVLNNYQHFIKAVAMKRLIVGVLLISLGLLLKSCNSVEPPAGLTINLKLEDVSCTEAWIELTTTNLQIPTTVTLKRDNAVTHTISLSSTDTLLYIDSLLPNQTYTFQSFIQSINQSEIKSNVITVQTLDTTSHNFTFETFTFGTIGSSTLYDVAIINENNIWAVGEMLIADTSINGYTTYNAVHWDGSQWEMERIKTNACGGVDYPPIEAILAFSSDDILFAHIDGSISHYNGIEFTNDCSLITQLNGSANKMWGRSKTDFYVVSGNGFIAHYLNGTWNKINSGTNTNINDVWGVVDKDGIEIIYCAVSFVFQTGDQKILTIKNNKVDSLSWNTGRRVYSIWTNSDNYLYTAGGGIFENKRGYWNEITEVPLYYSRNIRGTGINNIFVCGDFGLFAHFNGISWNTYNGLYIQGIYFSVAVNGNTVITVGLEGSKAIIVKGLRN